MSEAKNADFAAFPIPLDDRPGAYPAEPGMSMRDYFAAKAMQAFISTYPSGSAPCGKNDAWTIAEDSYEMADAMLKARQQ